MVYLSESLNNRRRALGVLFSQILNMFPIFLSVLSKDGIIIYTKIFHL